MSSSPAFRSSVQRSSGNDNNTLTLNRLPPLETPRAIATPQQRAVSADPNLSAARFSASARRTSYLGATPHARAALRDMRERRAQIFTPGRRRRSIRDQRETPHDILRNLSRVLAPSGRRIEYSSSSKSPSSSPDRNDAGTAATASARRRASTKRSIVPGEFDDDEAQAAALDDDDDDDDDGFLDRRPRFSLPMEEDPDDGIELTPPQISVLEEPDFTATSIELPRRANTEAPYGRFDRTSLGSMRRFGLMSDDVGVDSGFFPPDQLGDDTLNAGADIESPFVIAEERGGRRISDFPPFDIPDNIGNESTVLRLNESSPTRPIEGIDDDVGPDMGGGEDFDVDNEPLDMPDFGDFDLPEAEPYSPEMSAAALEPQDRSPSLGEGAGETIQEMTTNQSSLAAPPMRPTPQQRNQRISSAGQAWLKARQRKRVSRHGIEYPALPQGVVKRLASTFAGPRTKVGGDALVAIMQATDWFFEQLGDDLGAYARHAGRKTIDETDMTTLLRRQRQINASTTPFALAQRYLPRELLQEVRMPVPPPTKAPRKRKAKKAADEGDENEENEENVT